MQSFWLILNDEQKTKDLTKNELVLHEYILSEYENIPNYTISELAQNLYISPSTITRYIHKLNIDNFALLKHHIKNDVKFLKEKNSGINTLYNDIDDIDDTQLKELIKVLKKTKYIYVFGIEASSLTAQLLTRNLLKAGVCAIFISEIALITFNSKETLILVISNSGSTNIIKNLVQYAQDNQYPLYSLTKKNSYLHKHSKYAITHSNSEDNIYFEHENQVKILLMITLVTKEINS